jgi:hypothetical protein
MATISRKPARPRGKQWKRGIAAILVLLLFVRIQYAELFTTSVNDVVAKDVEGITQPMSASSSISSPLVACDDDKKTSSSLERDFFEIAQKTGTDKVAGYTTLPICLKDRESCTRKDCEREACRPWGHFYDTIYNRWLKKYSSDDAERVQFLEIGFYTGKGFEAYSQFLPRAEKHSMEISCIEPGPRSEGKWPEKWGNFAIQSPNYESLREAKRLHCGDANNYDFLLETWTKEMKRPDAPPLKVVIDDGSHITEHMATSLFFWLPRIEPGGILVMEDMQPISEANGFRTHILPQVMKDLHWCGDKNLKDTRCLPTIQPFLAGVHCEMHICVFVRNDVASIEPDKNTSMTPTNAFVDAQKCLFGPHFEFVKMNGIMDEDV